MEKTTSSLPTVEHVLDDPAGQDFFSCIAADQGGVVTGLQEAAERLAETPAPELNPAVQASVDKLLADPKFRSAMEYLQKDAANCLEEVKEMVLVHGASFKEHLKRSPMYRDKLAKYGAVDCTVDSAGNAFGYVRGTGAPRPQVLVEGHLDTVFPEETPLAVTEKDGWLFCPGIGDDTSSLACNLSVLRAIRHAGLTPVGTLLFGGTVGEEGEGNARGIRHLMQTLPGIDAVISVENHDADYIVTEAIGIRRYEVTFRAPGGHSWKDFGTPNPIHALGRAIAKIADLHTPADPRTTFSVGVITGGTSINSIAQSAMLKVDLRSVDMVQLEMLDVQVQTAIAAAVDEENARWGDAALATWEKKVIGSKPAGHIARDAVLTEVAMAATRAVGARVNLAGPSSTNQNIPVSMGVPALVVGSGGKFRGTHTLEESYRPEQTWLAAQKLLLMLFAMAGLSGVIEPLGVPCTERGTVA